MKRWAVAPWYSHSSYACAYAATAEEGKEFAQLAFQEEWEEWHKENDKSCSAEENLPNILVNKLLE